MNIQWHQATLLPPSSDVFTDIFYQSKSVFCALLPSNHANQRVVVVSNPDDHRTVRVLTAHTAASFLQPGRRTHKVAPKLNAVCEKEGIFKKFLLTEPEETPCTD